MRPSAPTTCAGRTFNTLKHSEAGPELVLVDDVHALVPIAGTSTLPYYPRTGQAPPDVDHVQHWEFSRGVRTGKTVLSSARVGELRFEVDPQKPLLSLPPASGKRNSTPPHRESMTELN